MSNDPDPDDKENPKSQITDLKPASRLKVKMPQLRTKIAPHLFPFNNFCLEVIFVFCV